ncbi:MAG: RluA family pseudouridine synthase [Planctomycetota bacterium]|jgi:23S rRNA pseudouridine1911/1915/1917 synthase
MIGGADADAGLAWAIRNEAKIERLLTTSHRLITVVVGPQSGVGLRADRYLALALPRLSRSLICTWIERGYGTRNGGKLRAKDKLRAGDELVFRCPLPPGAFDHDEPPALAILYDQDGILVVNKPPGLLAHQAGKHLSGTLLNQIQDLVVERGGDVRDARLVNRIDRDTSGIVLATTNEAVHRSLSISLQAHELRKEYQAICHGVPTPAHGHWRQAIRDDPTGQSIARQCHPSGQASHTEYQVVTSCPAGAASLLAITLHTGRQHQIRVHAATNGHPLIGDWTYGAPCAELPGQALHAAALTFPHPLSGEQIRIEAPLTAPLERLWQHLSAGGSVTERTLLPNEAKRLGLVDDDSEAPWLPDGWRRPDWLSRDELDALGRETGELRD